MVGVFEGAVESIVREVVASWGGVCDVGGGLRVVGQVVEGHRGSGVEGGGQQTGCRQLKELQNKKI